MAPNLRSVVAQVFQGGFRQAATRNFSSSPQGSRNGERVVVSGLKSSDSSLVPRDDPSLSSWIMAGYLGYFAWDMIELMILKRRLASGREERELKSQRLKELLSKNQLSKEQRARIRRLFIE